MLTIGTGTEADECGVYNETLTAGDGYYAVKVTALDFAATWSCAMDGTTSASCSESFTGPSANFPGAATTTLGPDEITFLPVSITAGIEKLSAGATASSGASTTAASSTGGSSASAASSGASSSSSSAAAVPRETGAIAGGLLAVAAVGAGLLV